MSLSTSQCAPSACRKSNSIYPSIGLIPDFWSCCLIMSSPIGYVVKLKTKTIKTTYYTHFSVLYMYNNYLSTCQVTWPMSKMKAQLTSLRLNSTFSQEAQKLEIKDNGN